MKNQNLLEGTSQHNWASYNSSPMAPNSLDYAEEPPPQMKTTSHSPQMKAKHKRSASPVGYTINGILGLQQDFEEKRKRSTNDSSESVTGVNAKRRREEPPHSPLRQLAKGVAKDSNDTEAVNLLHVTAAAEPNGINLRAPEYHPTYAYSINHDPQIHYNSPGIGEWAAEPLVDSDRGTGEIVIVSVAAPPAAPNSAESQIKEDYGHYATPSIYSSQDNVSGYSAGNSLALYFFLYYY